MAVISINYDEGSRKKNLGYKSVEIFYGTRRKKIFNTGDLVKDWYDCTKFMITKLADKEYAFLYSSSVDHFIMDSRKQFDTTLLFTEGGKTAYLEYNKNKLFKILMSDDDEAHGIQFFVKKGTTPTWAELRVLCGDKTKKKNAKK